MEKDKEIELVLLLNRMVKNNKPINLKLYPDFGETTINKFNNRLFINEGRDGKFNGVSESYFDLLVDNYM